MAAAKQKSKSDGSRTESQTEIAAAEPPEPLPERKRPALLVVSSVLLAAWLIFLAAMAYISTRGASIP